MAFKNRSSSINCFTGGTYTSPYIPDSTILTIAPIGNGTGFASVFVSQDGIDFREFSTLTTKYDLTRAIETEQFNFYYLQIVVDVGGTGTIIFEINQK